MSKATEPLIAAIEASDLKTGDWVEDKGVVKRIVGTPMVVAIFKDGYEIFHPTDLIAVRVEAHGERDK